jgi:hypothetical protein
LLDHLRRVHQINPEDNKKSKLTQNDKNFASFIPIIGSQVPITPSQSVYIKKSPVIRKNVYDINNNETYRDKTADKKISSRNEKFECSLCRQNFDQRNQLKMHNLFACGG